MESGTLIGLFSRETLSQTRYVASGTNPQSWCDTEVVGIRNLSSLQDYSLVLVSISLIMLAQRDVTNGVKEGL